MPVTTRFKINHRPDWLKNDKTGCNYEIDIFIPEFKIGVEYQGVYHFKNKLESNTKTDYVRYNDDRKQYLAKENRGVTIIEFFEDDLTNPDFQELFLQRVKARCKMQVVKKFMRRFKSKQWKDNKAIARQRRIIEQSPKTDINGMYVL